MSLITGEIWALSLEPTSWESQPSLHTTSSANSFTKKTPAFSKGASIDPEFATLMLQSSRCEHHGPASL